MIIDARTVFDTQRSKRWGCCRVSNPLIRVPRAGDRGGPTRGTTSRIRYARRGVTSVGDQRPRQRHIHPRPTTATIPAARLGPHPG